MLLQRLDRQRPGERELQEHGTLPLLVDGERVHPLRVTGLAEEGGRVRGVVELEEDPCGLLVEGRQEVRHGPAEPLTELLEALLGGARAGLRLAREPLHVLDQGQRVVPVGRVVDQRPGGEAEGLPPDLPDLGSLGVPYQPEEVQSQVLGLPEGARHQPHDAALAQRGMGVRTDGEGVGVLPGAHARRQQRPGFEQGGGGDVGGAGARAPDGAAAGRRGGVRGAHAARSSSSMSRPAYSAAAMRMPSDQATGPTRPSFSTCPAASVHIRGPVSVSS